MKLSQKSSKPVRIRTQTLGHECQAQTSGAQGHPPREGVGWEGGRGSSYYPKDQSREALRRPATLGNTPCVSGRRGRDLGPALGTSPAGCHCEPSRANGLCLLYPFLPFQQAELERALDVIQAKPLIPQRRDGGQGSKSRKQAGQSPSLSAEGTCSRAGRGGGQAGTFQQEEGRVSQRIRRGQSSMESELTEAMHPAPAQAPVELGGCASSWCPHPILPVSLRDILPTLRPRAKK